MPTHRPTLTDRERRELVDRFTIEAEKYERLADVYARTGDLAYAAELNTVANDYREHIERLG